MSDRATCWSITINNPTDDDMQIELPAGWRLTGQIEQGEEGTRHYQGMLNTPQVRFSAVKKVFKRAHIEIAKNKKALEKYVHKVETRIAEVADRTSDIPTLFEYQTIIAAAWDNDEFAEMVEKPANQLTNTNELAMRYVDNLVARDIEENGRRGAEFIGINPMWRSSWKIFWRSIIKRRDAQKDGNKAPGSREEACEAGCSEAVAAGEASHKEDCEGSGGD